MRPILLINPNTSVRTTQAMAAICRKAVPDIAMDAATATRGAAMIVDAEALAASEAEVVATGLREAPRLAGIIVAAFGDPGLDALRRQAGIPVTGICEASMREASAGGRRFGVATVTPGLVAAIDGRAAASGLGALYSGTRLTSGDPLALAGDPARLRDELAAAIEACIRRDGAEAVIIGGGPLAEAAEALQGHFSAPIVAPLPAAARRIAALIGAAASS